jgi:WD40 repeat protein
MSPEQVRAEPVDARSDIFSFGAVLYEMLSGRRAFRGETSVETLNAILKEDPPDISEPGHPLPAALERTVRRSLEKDPRARFQSAQDLAFALEALSGDTRASSTGAIPIHGAAVASRRAWLAATGAGLALAVAAFFVGRRSAEHPAPTFERLTYRHGRVGEARFAPDGQTIVYSAEWEAQPPRLFSARAGSMESRPLDLPDAALLAVSSSGEMALSLRSQWDATQDSPRGTLARVPLAGGAPREVVDGVLGADWSPDGSVLAAIRPGHGLEFPLGSSIARSDGDGFGHPRVSPRGDLVALFEWRGWPCAVVVIDRKGATRALTGYDYRLCSGLAWSPDGKEIWFTGVDASGAQPLRAVSLEGRTRVVHAMPGRSSLRDISREGDVLLTSGLVRFSVYGHVPGADAERNLSWFGNSYLEDLSADGSTILLGDFLSGAGVNPIFMRRTDGSPAVRLGDGEDGRISPDGKWVAASLAHPPRIVLLPTGAGPSRELPVAPCTVYNLDWFADGRRLLATCRKNDAGHTVVTWTQDLEGGAPHPILDGYMGILAAPDGRSVLAVQGEDGLYHLCALDGGGCRKLETLDAEKEEPLRWSSDSRSLFVAAHSGEASLTLARMDVATGRREVLKTLAPPDPTGVFGLSWIQITPDGRHYAYSFGRWLSDLYLVKGLR